MGGMFAWAWIVQDSVQLVRCSIFFPYSYSKLLGASLRATTGSFEVPEKKQRRKRKQVGWAEMPLGKDIISQQGSMVTLSTIPQYTRLIYIVYLYNHIIIESYNIYSIHYTLYSYVIIYCITYSITYI